MSSAKSLTALTLLCIAIEPPAGYTCKTTNLRTWVLCMHGGLSLSCPIILIPLVTSQMNNVLIIISPGGIKARLKTEICKALPHSAYPPLLVLLIRLYVCMFILSAWTNLTSALETMSNSFASEANLSGSNNPSTNNDAGRDNTSSNGTMNNVSGNSSRVVRKLILFRW